MAKQMNNFLHTVDPREQAHTLVGTIREDYALKIEMRLLLTSKNRTRPLNNYVMTVFDQNVARAKELVSFLLDLLVTRYTATERSIYEDAIRGHHVYK